MFTSLILGFTHYSQGLAGKCPNEIYSGRARNIPEYNPRKTTLTLAVSYHHGFMHCVCHSFSDGGLPFNRRRKRDIVKSCVWEYSERIHISSIKRLEQERRQQI